MVGDVRGRRRLKGISAWPLWDLPAVLLWPILCVELTAVFLVVLALWAQPTVSVQELTAAAILGGLGIAHTEVARPVEKMRWRMISGDLYCELTSVWIFAAAILIPSGYAAVLAAIVHFYLWLRSGRKRAHLHREVFTCATNMLSCLAAATVMQYVHSIIAALGDPSATALAEIAGMLVFLTVNSALVAGAIAASSAGASAADLLGQWDDNLVEVAALVLGAGVATVLPTNPWLVGLLLVPVLVLQRGALVGQLQEAATVDSKTGLLNASAWTNRANAELGSRRLGSRHLQAVMVLDLDRFKQVNDRHGHVAGDRVLAAVGAALRREVRDCDIVGRFGGEEFVVFLAGDDGGGLPALEAVADRLRERIERLRVEISTPDGPLSISDLTISVGVAVCDGTHTDLQELIETADTACYAAKGDGRNRVRVGGLGERSRPHEAVLSPDVADRPGRRASDRVDKTQLTESPIDTE